MGDTRGGGRPARGSAWGRVRGGRKERRKERRKAKHRRGPKSLQQSRFHPGKGGLDSASPLRKGVATLPLARPSLPAPPHSPSSQSQAGPSEGGRMRTSGPGGRGGAWPYLERVPRRRRSDRGRRSGEAEGRGQLSVQRATLGAGGAQGEPASRAGLGWESGPRRGLSWATGRRAGPRGSAGSAEAPEPGVRRRGVRLPLPEPEPEPGSGSGRGGVAGAPTSPRPWAGPRGGGR